ncbi:MAG: DUF2007 domain-containing protein [Ruminococcaceae bacterium]|nr:DUF2007 domain-containing protein [Oscillospiraceae bacterium]
MDRIFGLDSASNQEGLALVATIYNPAELAVIQTVLNSAEIPFLAKDRGAGGMVKVVMGYSVYGTDIFVREEDAEVAMELLTPVEDIDGEQNDD